MAHVVCNSSLLFPFLVISPVKRRGERGKGKGCIFTSIIRVLLFGQRVTLALRADGEECLHLKRTSFGAHQSLSPRVVVAKGDRRHSIIGTIASSNIFLFCVLQRLLKFA